jgi:glycosyltransferase involved in cell wall biosynthesis
MSQRFYLLVVRHPTGGIRTHLKYLKVLAPMRPNPLQPVLVCPEGVDGQALAQTLALPPELVLSQGVRSLRDMARAIWGASRRYGARLIHSHGFGSATVATPAALVHRRAHLVTAHDVITGGVLERTSRLERNGLGFALRAADRVHAVSHDCAESIRLLPFMKQAENIEVISNGIDPQQFRHVDPRDLRAELGLEANTFVVGFFGRFMAQKGFRTLVDAVGLLQHRADLPNILVLAVGSGGFIREDKDYVRSLGLSSRFRFMDAVENPAPLIAAVDCVAMPSRWEAYGLLAAEVMALGVPLLASTCIGLREVTLDTPARSFAPEDASQLAAAITAEIDDRSRGRAAEFRAEALRRFDFTPNARRIADLIDALYARTGGGS